MRKQFLFLAYLESYSWSLALQRQESISGLQAAVYKRWHWWYCQGTLPEMVKSPRRHQASFSTQSQFRGVGRETLNLISSY
ncbi:hypothetical protein GGI35DRAFT_13800 [Trichoderma velutinum]